MASFFRCFRYAAHGIWVAVRDERNMRFHLCMAAYVYLFSFFYSFSRAEYLLLTVLVVGVLALELLNSALERALDALSPGPSDGVGIAKDMAAGAVLVFSIGAAICGVWLFFDIPVLRHILYFLTTDHPILLAALLASLAGCWYFVFHTTRRKDKSTNA